MPEPILAPVAPAVYHEAHPRDPHHRADPKTTLLNAALAQAQLGFRVFPAYPKTKTPHWRGYKSLATTDADTIVAWWQRYPTDNPMCLVPRQYAIVDTDPRHGGLEGLQVLELQHGPLPYTWDVQTAAYDAEAHDHGSHHYYRVPEGVTIPQTTVLAAGVQLLGPAHPLMCPGAIHDKRDHVYTWNEFTNPKTMPCADLPRWILDHALDAQPLSRREEEEIKGGQGGQDSLRHGREVAEKLTGSAVDALYLDEAIVQRSVDYLAELQGKPAVVLGKSFLAWFREEKHASAVIMRPGKGYPHFLYFDHNEFDAHGLKVKGKSLPEVYFRILNGYWPDTLPSSTYLMWSVRLLVESGAVQAPDVHFQPLPDDAPPEAHRADAGFQLLEKVRALLARPANDPDEDMPYSERFCAAWTQLTQRAAHCGIMWLLSRGYTLFKRVKDRCAFYVRGTTRLIRRLIHAPIATHQASAIKMNQEAQEALRCEDDAFAAQIGHATANLATQQALQGEAAPLRRRGQHAAAETPQDCPTCGKDDFKPVGDGCEYCQILEPLQARLDAKKRLYGSPRLVDLPPPKVVYGVDE